MDERFKLEGYQIQPVDPATNIIVSLVNDISPSLRSKAHTGARQAVKRCLDERRIEYVKVKLSCDQLFSRSRSDRQALYGAQVDCILLVLALKTRPRDVIHVFGSRYFNTLIRYQPHFAHHFLSSTLFSLFFQPRELLFCAPCSRHNGPSNVRQNSVEPNGALDSTNRVHGATIRGL